MYGNEAESTISASNATVTVNDIVVTLPESVPYGEYNLSKYYNALYIYSMYSRTEKPVVNIYICSFG